MAEDDESVKLQSGDNEVFSVSKEVACQAVTIKEMLEGAHFPPLPCPPLLAPRRLRPSPPPPLPPSAPRRGACGASVARFLPRAAGPTLSRPCHGQTCRERSPSPPRAGAGRHRADRRSPGLRPPADTESDTAIPLPNVESPILSKVIEYCTWHVKAEQDRTAEDTRNEWNSKFVDVDQGTLFHLILVRASPRVLRRLYERSAPTELTFECTAGCQLLEHQVTTRPDVQNRGGYDQGEDAGGNPGALQHSKRLHTGGGGGGAVAAPCRARAPPWTAHSNPLCLSCQVRRENAWCEDI
jgi:hypothetical protein